MKKSNFKSALKLVHKIFGGLLISAITMTSFAADNTLSASESNAGWQLLFNGKDMVHWRNFKQDNIDSKWKIDQGAMFLSTGGGGDILTKRAYKNFELKLEWKISNAGNSGIFVLADELGSQIYSHAIEVQILDNERHSDNKINSHLSGSLFDIVPSPKISHKAAGLWNQVHIRLLNSAMTVWQNGVKTADVVIGDKKWNGLVAQSKFKTWQGFAQAKTGHIGLQDHSDPVWFKNIKIKELK